MLFFRCSSSQASGEMFDVVVVGAGLIGSAAAKYLARSGMSVALVGPVEPSNYADTEVFASHYDEGRIVRSIDKDEFWSELAQASLARFSAIEKESGIRFHERVGFLHAGFPPGHEGDALSNVLRMSARFGIAVARLEGEELRRAFPFFAFEKACEGLLESGLSGYVNPKGLAAAQQAIFAKRGGTLIRDVVDRIGRNGAAYTIQGRQNSYSAARVVVSAGAWTHLNRLTPHGIHVDVRPETVILIPVTAEEAASLHEMPPLWYTFDWHPIIPYLYLVPPLRFPDGRFYIKLGADNDRDVGSTTADEAAAYFRSGGSQVTRRNLKDVADRFLPMFADRDVLTKPCILTYTADRRPLIMETEPGWFVATAGNGAGAKSSDEIGRLASELVLGRGH